MTKIPIMSLVRLKAIDSVEPYGEIEMVIGYNWADDDPYAKPGLAKVLWEKNCRNSLHWDWEDLIQVGFEESSLNEIQVGS